jgi:CO/xanthine dehydrogenase FAD-binding subunit
MKIKIKITAALIAVLPIFLTEGDAVAQAGYPEALADVAPLSDLHASAEYRRRVAVNLATRAVADARSHAIGKKLHAH